MNLYPNGGYNRVTHYTDIVVQIPTRKMGFNHAGNEVWYYYYNDNRYNICENNPGQPENSSCADSYLLTTGIDAHLNYLGRPISKMCNVAGLKDPEMELKAVREYLLSQ